MNTYEVFQIVSTQYTFAISTIINITITIIIPDLGANTLGNFVRQKERLLLIQFESFSEPVVCLANKEPLVLEFFLIVKDILHTISITYHYKTHCIFFSCW